MEMKIRRFDTSIPLPEYKTSGAVALDLSPRIDAVIQPGEIVPVPLNIALEPPRGHVVLMAARSSLWKRGLQLINGVGVFDEDFSGDDDEYRAILRNFTDTPVEIKQGERIVQIMVLPYVRVELIEQERMNNPNRGGIGSTGI
jgi:dUTP pyrophosphatase